MLEQEQQTEHTDTQRRIIEAAGEIFADSGYRHTPVRAICERAGVNVAAVNYHFGNKKNLYLAVLDYWRARAIEKHPFDMEHQTGTAEDRLRAFARVILSRVLDQGEGSRFAKLMAQELIQPTEAFDSIIEETVRPTFAFLSAIVRELFKKPPRENTVALCCISIVGQIFYFYMSKHMIRKVMGKERFEKTEIEAVADHITRFSLYAIKEMAAKSEGENE